jgi:hypothetical protein
MNAMNVLRWAPLLLLLASCSNPQRDFEKLCAMADGVITDPTVAREHKVAELSRRFKRWRPGNAARRCVEGALDSHASPSQKYRALEACARDSGARGWACPMLQQFMESPAGEAGEQ